MNAIDTRNSITYDPEKDELKIVTHYNEQQFKELWIRDMQIGFLKYMMKVRDPKIKNPWLKKINAIWGLYWLLLIAGTLYYLIKIFTSGISLLAFVLVTAIFIYLWNFVISFRKFCVQKGIEQAKSQELFHRKELQATMTAIQQAFNKQPMFCQEIIITCNSHTATMPYPDAPCIHSIHGDTYVRAFQDDKDLYILQLTPPKQPYPYYPGENIHLAKNNYTPEEWKCLTVKLREMQYFLK